jgi:hypothetical protein
VISDIKSKDLRRPGVTLFLVGFLVLFFELSCIRWFSARVIFLQFLQTSF